MTLASGSALVFFLYQRSLLSTMDKEHSPRNPDPVFNISMRHKAFENYLTNIVEVPKYIVNVSSIQWNTTDLESKLVFSVSSECPLCNNHYKHPKSNSNSRDLVLTCMLGYTRNALTWIRSLRSTGCKAAVVVFLDSKARQVMTPSEKIIFEKCGMILIDIGDFLPPYNQHVFEARHIFFFAFLRRFQHLYDRILLLDLADSFIQYDPFTDEITNTTFQTTTEIVTFETCPVNTKWVVDCDPEYDASFYAKKVPLNLGFIFGSIGGFMYYYDFIYRQKDWAEFDIHTIDQGYQNYYYYRGLFANHGLHLTATLPGDTLVSVRGGRVRMEPNSDGLWVLEGTNRPSAVYHQYNRICPLWKGVQEVCPPIGEKEQSFALLKEISHPCE